MKQLIKKWNEISLVKRIICGLILGIILGLAIPQITVISLLGDLFVGALRAIAPILVLFLVMGALANQKEGKQSNMKRVIFLYLLYISCRMCGSSRKLSFSDHYYSDRNHF